MARKFAVVIEKGEIDYIAYVPSLPGCFTQAQTIEKLTKNIREAIELYLEVKKDNEKTDFVGVQIVEVK